jgi:hypothetical protein
LRDGHVIRWKVSSGTVNLEQSMYCSEFGRRDPTQCIAVSFGREGVRMSLDW